tara:strand:+ start:1029 stop:2021 length:993 start_codon:yes stop_codon:yes gene_type:complete
MNHIKPLREFLYEQVSEEPYRFVVVYNDPSNVGDDSKEETDALADKMLSFGNELGLTGFKTKIEESYIIKKDDKLFIYDKEDKEFEIDENTIIFNRSKSNDFPSWQNFYRELTLNGVTVINPMQVHNICWDKYHTYLRLRDNYIKQPLTVLVNDLDKLENIHQRIGGKFPVVLKTILGTGGVGVLKINDEAQLLSSAQIINKLGSERGMILQQYIPIEFDVRVIMVAGKIMGAMKRNIADGDFRSNIHQGSKPEKYQLTKLEEEVCYKVDKTINGKWIGVDLIVSKDREKEEPYVLEINSQPGHVGYDSVHSGSILKDVLKTFMNRDNWT